MGLDGLAWVDAHAGYGAYAITADHRSVWTPVVDAPPRLTTAGGLPAQASGSTLPGLRIPSGSSAVLIARIIATAPSPRWRAR